MEERICSDEDLDSNLLDSSFKISLPMEPSSTKVQNLFDGEMMVRMHDLSFLSPHASVGILESAQSELPSTARIAASHPIDIMSPNESAQYQTMKCEYTVLILGFGEQP